MIELLFQTRNKQGGKRCQTGKKIKVTKERVAAEAASSPAVARVAVDNTDNMLAAVKVAADNPVDSVAAVEAVAIADRGFSYF